MQGPRLAVCQLASWPAGTFCRQAAALLYAIWQASGPPLWDACDAHVGEGVAPELDWATDWG